MKLQAEQVGHRFTHGGTSVTALETIDLTIEESELVSIVGPSGCGKSTFLNLVAGFLTPTHGRLLLDRQGIDGPGADRGVVFQEHALFPWMTVERNVGYGLRVRGVPREEQRQAIAKYLSLVGLTRFAGTYPKALSGGMKQRVALARALVNEPKMILMDEPFAALDAQTRRVLQDELIRIWQQTRVTILFVTHNIEEAVLLSDRIYVMTACPGRIKTCVSVDLPRPRNDTDPAFVLYKQRIGDMLKGEIEQALIASGDMVGHQQ
jgi:NitT/TauT family transport system ATP-binding protein